MTFFFLLCFALLFGLLETAVANGLIVRPLPGRSPGSTIREITRRLHLASREDGVVFDTSMSLDASIQDFPLFSYTHGSTLGSSVEAESKVEIVCTTCYIKGRASAKLTSKGEFNISTVAYSVKDAFNETFHEIVEYADTVVDEAKEWARNNTETIFESGIGPESLSKLEDFDFPSPEIDFNVDIGDFPDTVLEVMFEDTEIYVALGITLSSGITYTLNLYSSKQLGIEIDEILVGVVASIDLILSVEAAIEIDTGFHIKLDKTVGMTLALFADEASHLTFNGGSFEFLPVTVATAGVVLRAVLRVGVRTGFSVDADFGTFIKAVNRFNGTRVAAGIEASAYANVAEFVTNITANDVGALVGGETCDLVLEQGYQFAIGAAAGATVQIFGDAWGPEPQTEIPIFYTTISTGCAASKTAAPATSAAVGIQERADDDFITTTTVTKLTFSAVGCVSRGMTNCPASLQTMSTNVVTSTLSTTLPSGSTVVWPASSGQAASVTAVPFGANAMSMTASTGKPQSYTPPPPSPSSSAGNSSEGEGDTSTVINGKTRGVSNKVIIGVTVGLGVPLIAAVIAGTFFWRRRRMYKSVQSGPQLSDVLDGDRASPKKRAATEIRPVRDNED